MIPDTPRYLRKAHPIRKIILPKIEKKKTIEKIRKKEETKLERERRKARERRFQRQRKRQLKGTNVGFYTVQRRRLKEEAEQRRKKDLEERRRKQELEERIRKRNKEKADLVQAYRKWTLNCRRRKMLMHRIKQIEEEERNESISTDYGIQYKESSANENSTTPC